MKHLLLYCLMLLNSWWWKPIHPPPPVHAFGDLTVNFHVPAGDPIFDSDDFKPGDSETKPVDVTNSGSTARMVAVKGVKTDGSTELPNLEDVLDLVILEGTTPLYGRGSSAGARTLLDFFDDSSTEDGIELGMIAPGENKQYLFQVSFPSEADNRYQEKRVVFDLTFGTVAADHIVINEVYYQVDSKHGKEPPGDDRFHESKCNKNDKKCREKEGEDRKKGIGHEWIELYNPTSKDISLKNWTITDNTGEMVKINANKVIKAGEFALLSHDSSLWKYWDEPKKVLKVELGKFFGNGLNNDGDRVILKNAQGEVVDRMSWGNDNSGFVPPASIPVAPTGSSLERIVPGYDDDKVADWHIQTPPTPGK